MSFRLFRIQTVIYVIGATAVFGEWFFVCINFIYCVRLQLTFEKILRKSGLLKFGDMP